MRSLLLMLCILIAILSSEETKARKEERGLNAILCNKKKTNNTNQCTIYTQPRHHVMKQQNNRFFDVPNTVACSLFVLCVWFFPFIPL